MHWKGLGQTQGESSLKKILETDHTDWWFKGVDTNWWATKKTGKKIKYVWWAFLLSLMLHLCSFVVGYIRLPGRDLVVSLSNLSAQKAHNEKKGNT